MLEAVQLQMIYSFNLHWQKYISIYTQPLMESFNMGCKVSLPTFSLTSSVCLNLSAIIWHSLSLIQVCDRKGHPNNKATACWQTPSRSASWWTILHIVFIWWAHKNTMHCFSLSMPLESMFLHKIQIFTLC